MIDKCLTGRGATVCGGIAVDGTGESEATKLTVFSRNKDYAGVSSVKRAIRCRGRHASDHSVSAHAVTPAAAGGAKNAWSPV